MVGVLACLSVPPLALSTGDGGGHGGCPPTGTTDPAPCLAGDGSDVEPAPPEPPSPPADSGGGSDASQGASGGGEQSGAGAAQGDAPAPDPGSGGPQPLSSSPPPPDAAPPPDAKPQKAAVPPAPKATPQRRSPRHRATRLGKPRVEARAAPRHDRGGPPSPRRVPKAVAQLPSGGGVSGTSPLPVSSPLAPAPSAGSVPNVLLDRFPIPPFLLPIYQAAGIEYGVPWQVLAAINEIESDYGRNLSVSSAGAQGWMQFMPSSWRAYGVDANGDGRKDPYNPADAIFAAARYLKAAGAARDLRRAVFAYNHAWWYVDSVMLRARLVRALPADLVSSLTALTQGRIPVAGPSRWRHTRDKHHRQLVVEAPPAAPVVAVNDGQVVGRGFDRRLGAYLMLRDAYGNTYTYSHLGSVARQYAAVRPSALDAGPPQARAAASDPRPKGPATAGGQHPATAQAASSASGVAADPRPVVVKERLFAHPGRAASYAAGGARQVAAQPLGAAIPGARVSAYFAGPVRLSAHDLVLRPLRRGARVIGGTVLGHVGPASAGQVLSRMEMTMRPAGGPAVDAQPFVNGWRLLAASGVYGGAAGGPLRAASLRRASIGQILLMTKEQLIQRVLSDPRIRIYPCGRRDVATGQIDRRVLATLEYLAANDLRPLVSALKCGHSYYTKAGTVSEHSYGSAVDIASINGIAILGHQGQGSITDRTIRKLLQLQGTMKPHQIISLMTFPGADNTLSLSDHADHIHVGFSPGAGVGPGGAATTLQPRQWTRLVDRLGEIENPTLAAPAPVRPLRSTPPPQPRPRPARWFPSAW